MADEEVLDELLDELFPPDWQLSRETEHRQYDGERGN